MARRESNGGAWYHRGVIIDAHTHVFPETFRARRDALAAKDPLFAEMYGVPSAAMATPAELLAAMDEAGVHAAVICGFAWEDPALCREHNDTLLEAAAHSRGRLLPFTAVSLRDLDGAAAEASRCRALGARGIGELRPAAHGLDLSDPGAADALAAVAGGLPLLIHASEPVGHDYRGKGGQPIGPLYHFLHRHPEVKVIAAHMGGGLPLYAHMPDVRRALSRTWVDTAAWPLLYEPSIFRHIADLIGATRILFATDFPLRRYKRELELLATVPLSDDERHAVLGRNAAALLGLEAR
jgi:predicted TIM-barrel fold metal-dependent hydrolase